MINNSFIDDDPDVCIGGQTISKDKFNQYHFCRPFIESSSNRLQLVSPSELGQHYRAVAFPHILADNGS